MTPRLWVDLRNRDFTGPAETIPMDWDVLNLSWEAIGGPDQANFEVTGPTVGLWQLLETLRDGVTVWDAMARRVWWGYISEVTLTTPTDQHGLSLEGMANRVRVGYSYIATGTSDPGQRKTTAWLEDADSVAKYGKKEKLLSQSGMTDAAAAARQTATLARLKNPLPTDRFGGGAITAQVTCRGWWDTLAWQYAEVAAGTATAVTTQITNLVNTYGQFLTGTYIDAASTVTTMPYRDGDTTAQAEIAALLAIGGPNGRRYLARVDEARYLRVYEEPTAGTIWWSMDERGRLYDESGAEWPGYLPPVGEWVRLLNAVPIGAPMGNMDVYNAQLIERAEWSPDGGLVLTYRDQSAIGKLLEVDA